MAITRQGLTLEQFLALPEEKPALEYDDGMVTQKVPPAIRHSALQFQLATLFNRFMLPRKLARAFPELRTTFAGRSRVPDVAVVGWERIARLPDGKLVDGPLREAPLIAVEIRSPEQRRNALLTHCQWYADHGVALTLLIEPDDETITLFRAGASPQSLRAGDRLDLGDTLPGFTLLVAEVFEALRAD
jgi:Uma2 family endonuclease